MRKTYFHFYIFFLKKKGAINRFNHSCQKNETGVVMETFIRKVKDRKPYESDNEIIKKFYLEFLSKQDLTKIYEKSYLSNDYFEKNKDFYTRKEGMKSENYHVFEQERDGDRLKLKYFDGFLTRYIYYSFTRWGSKVLLYLRLKSE